MITHPISDEILERLWYFREKGRVPHSLTDLKLGEGTADDQAAALAALVADGQVRSTPDLELHGAGDDRARGIVRRHRLAEILFNQILDIDLKETEESACEFEHILAEQVVNRVCTFLGHPPKCPHGRAIPQGACCRKFERHVEPLITRLTDMRIGAQGKIVFIAPKSPSRLNRLATLGVIAGSRVRLVQRRPSFVISAGETMLALEDDIAAEIYVRPGESPE
jgi:DtxR family Mn-dependent transcriptional regulator